jgi:hypothetical protein
MTYHYAWRVIIGSGERARFRILGMAVLIGLILSVTLPACGSEPQQARRFFFAPHFGRMFYTGDTFFEDMRVEGDEIEVERLDYDLGWMWGASLGLALSERLDLLGTFNMGVTEITVTESFEPGGTGPLDDEYTYATSLGARIAAITGDKSTIYSKVGLCLLISESPTSDVGFGAIYGLGVKWEISQDFRFALEAEGYLPLSPEDATGRLSVALVPEITLVSF